MSMEGGAAVGDDGEFQRTLYDLFISFLCCIKHSQQGITRWTD